tara:strand:+ start:52 stop:1332 length:1281 start_codon:yes stop_codon:yes gene_type:complete
MKNLILIENFNTKYSIPGGEIITLNAKSHYELSKRGIEHHTISEIIDFEAYLTHEEAYNDHQKLFFDYCDKDYQNNVINNKVKFSPFRIIGFEIKTVFDSLFSQTLIIYEIIKKIKPQKIYLFSSKTKKENQIDYLACSKGNYYDFIFCEILEYLSTFINYSYEIITVPKSISLSIYDIKNGLKNHIRNTKYFNIYRQIPITKNIGSFDNDYFKTIVGCKNLFMNQGWGLNKLVQYSLLSNPETIVLLNNYLFVYSESKNSKCFPIAINNIIKPEISSSQIKKHVTYFDNFIKDSIGISLYGLVYKRITFFNDKIFPTLLFGCKTLDKMLIELNVDKVIGNMRMPIKENLSTNIITHILPYISTIDPNYNCLYFTHGYDPYVLDRTFLELPCNNYYTHNEEYKNYFTESFKNQRLFEQPKTEVFKL